MTFIIFQQAFSKFFQKFSNLYFFKFNKKQQQTHRRNYLKLIVSCQQFRFIQCNYLQELKARPLSNKLNSPEGKLRHWILFFLFFFNIYFSHNWNDNVISAKIKNDQLSVCIVYKNSRVMWQRTEKDELAVPLYPYIRSSCYLKQL